VKPAATGGHEVITQSDKAEAFRRLHEKGSCFVIPNFWDAGSARLLEHAGFKALASSSAGFAFSQARADLHVSKASLMSHLTAVCQATALPVSADLQNGFGNDPEDMAVTILQAARTGIVGGSIEDATGGDASPVYPLELAAERIRHAAVAARSLGFGFTLTARAENYLYGRDDLQDTIRRLQAYQEAGADVLFAPGIRSPEDIRQIVKSIDRPLNVLVGMPGMQLNVMQLRDLGVTRISLGGTLARSAYGALLQAAAEIQGSGTFGYTSRAASGQELAAIFSREDH
jgi:2-methylisocitrate lyase-like PEP mutase family enzyme